MIRISNHSYKSCWNCNSIIYYWRLTATYNCCRMNCGCWMNIHVFNHLCRTDIAISVNKYNYFKTLHKYSWLDSYKAVQYQLKFKKPDWILPCFVAVSIYFISSQTFRISKSIESKIMSISINHRRCGFYRWPPIARLKNPRLLNKSRKFNIWSKDTLYLYLGS
jgi:hypothetical protein